MTPIPATEGGWQESLRQVILDSIESGLADPWLCEILTAVFHRQAALRRDRADLDR